MDYPDYIILCINPNNIGGSGAALLYLICKSKMDHRRRLARDRKVTMPMRPALMGPAALPLVEYTTETPLRIGSDVAPTAQQDSSGQLVCALW